MGAVEELRGRIPEAAKDIRLNLQAVLQDGGPLSAQQRWGVAVASAVAARNQPLLDAVVEDARAAAGDDVVDDAHAAAALMAMNNVYYRFRHMIGKPSYGQKPARLRMQRLAQPRTSKVDVELFSLAVSAIHGCEMCLRAHEKVVLDGGLSEDHVHDAVRIAAVVHAAALSLQMCVGSGTAAPTAGA